MDKQQAINHIGDRHKFDGGKTRWDLIPWDILEKIAEVYTKGAQKYTDNGWKGVPNAEKRYFSALMRHLMRYLKDPYCRDEELDLEHIYQVAWNAIALAWFMEQSKKERNNGSTCK